MSQDRKLYVLTRRVMFLDSREWVVCSDEVHPVAAFASKTDADAARDVREGEFRRKHDVWTIFGNNFGGDDCPTIHQTAIRLGLLPADFVGDGWKCWESFTAPPTDEQRIAFWDAVPDYHLYRVVETTLRD